MKITNYHTHTTYCDGKNSPEEMVLAAIGANMSEIGFSVHSPLPFATDWAIKEERLDEYKNELFSLREKYKEQIRIYVGIEQDYFSENSTDGFDYVIGSVHFIYKNGEYLAIDISADEVKANIKKHYGGDALAYCEDYYNLVKDVYNKTKCQIIGHFDLVTKFNEKMPLIDTSAPRYKKAAREALSELVKSPAIFEINTGAISRGYRTCPYPQEEIMDEIADSGKPFVINSDSHSVETVGFGIKELMRELSVCGYRYIRSLNQII